MAVGDGIAVGPEVGIDVGVGDRIRVTVGDGEGITVGSTARMIGAGVEGGEGTTVGGDSLVQDKPISTSSDRITRTTFMAGTRLQNRIVTTCHSVRFASGNLSENAGDGGDSCLTGRAWLPWPAGHFLHEICDVVRLSGFREELTVPTRRRVSATDSAMLPDVAALVVMHCDVFVGRNPVHVDDKHRLFRELYI